MQRNRELVNFLPVVVLMMIGFASVYAARSSQMNASSLTYGLLFVGLFLAVHLFLRLSAPYADPFLLPLAALMSAIGIMMIYRIDPDLAAAQTTWLMVGLGFLVGIMIFLRHYRKLENYIYICGIVGVLLLIITVILGINENGAFLSIRVGSIQFQPGEFSKVLITIFLAGYLNSKRELLSTTTWHLLGIPMPALKHLGPLVTMWGMSFALLLLMNDLGTSMLFFGVFLAMTYVATNRLTYPVIGGILFIGGAALAYNLKGTVRTRVDIWIDPWSDAMDRGYQLVQSLFAIGDGGLFGTGLGKGYLLLQNGEPIVPALHTDFIFSAIAEELGLAGATALIVLFLIYCYRVFKIAIQSDDGFSKLLAAGLGAGFALQTFVILGGVMKLIPLTGITLPFVSYGGSSIVANFGALALLLLISNRTNKERRR